MNPERNEPRDRSRYPEVLEDICEKLMDVLVNQGVPDALAGDIGFQASEWMRKNISGRNIYICKPGIKASARQACLFHDGANEEPCPNLADWPEATHYSEWLAMLALQVGEWLLEAGLTVETAIRSRDAVAEFVSLDWSGDGGLYIPKGVYYDISKRDLEIYRRFHSWNRYELCKEYDLSEQRIYKIVATVHARERKRMQPTLFE